MDNHYIDATLSDPDFSSTMIHISYGRSCASETWAIGLGFPQGLPVYSALRRHHRAVSEPSLFSSAYLIGLPSSPLMEKMTPAMMGSGEMMLMMDPSLHGAMRRAFNRLMLPRAVGASRHRYCNWSEILEEAMERGECDFVVDVTARLP
jgi:cytochrome P450